MCFARVAGGADSSAASVHIGTVRLPSPGHGDPPDTAGDSGTQVMLPAFPACFFFLGGGGGHSYYSAPVASVPNLEQNECLL